MQTNYDQSKMWAFYENENVDSFSGAIPRLRSLARTVFRLARWNGIAKLGVLNIGVGSGYLEELILRGGGEAFSVDRDERTLARLAGKNLKGYVAKVEHLPFNDKDLDFVVVAEI
jgi:SAM-dependent methyltransferase